MKIWNFLSLALAVLFAFTLASCGGSSDGDSSTGQVSVSMIDAPASEYKAVYVTISEVQVHRSGDGEGQWETILYPNATYDLLDLVNGNAATLGIADLPTGTYTQMRLILGDDPDDSLNVLGEHHDYPNYVITSDDVVHELKVPSGYQSGIKLVHNFDVTGGRTVGLILDFDAEKSVVQAGNSGNWLLKPTIKVLDVVNLALLSGEVTDESLAPIEGAVVSAQTYDPDTDAVTVESSTATDISGSYLLYLTPGTYTIVVTANDHAIAARKITVAYNTDYTEDFTLPDAVWGTVYVDLTLPEDSTDAFAELQFRQVSPADAEEQIEVKTANFGADSGDTPYEVSLPPEVLYNIIAICGDIFDSQDDVEVGDTVSFNFNTL